jgi:tetratricopeptide (TPR) repeat protein
MVALAMLALGTLVAAPSRAAPDPFAKPVKNCQPCRFSPGRGMPDFDVTFRFTGTGGARVLTDIALAPSGGGPAQVFATGGVAVSDFPDGFSLTAGDIDGSGLGDISLVTLQAADNANALSWVYDPATKRFSALRRDDANGGDCPVQWSAADRLLTCHVVGSNIEYTDYEYRLDGDRTVAVRATAQTIDGPLLKHVTTDLSARPPKVVRSRVVGFTGASPERTAFLARMDAAAKLGAARYRAGDRAGAAAAMTPVLAGMNLYALTGSDPVTTLNAPEDLRVVAELNDHGFYLEQAGRAREAVGVLDAVVELDRDRLPAWLNLADAQFANGDPADAKRNYAEYRKRMIAAGKPALIPARVAERLR